MWFLLQWKFECRLCCCRSQHWLVFIIILIWSSGLLFTCSSFAAWVHRVLVVTGSVHVTCSTVHCGVGLTHAQLPCFTTALQHWFLKDIALTFCFLSQGTVLVLGQRYFAADSGTGRYILNLILRLTWTACLPCLHTTVPCLTCTCKTCTKMTDSLSWQFAACITDVW